MKATELMIGDWVMAIDTPARVMGIDTVSPMEKIWAETAGDGCNPLSTEQISPIPLADEILAKNGFGKKSGLYRIAIHIDEYNGFMFSLAKDFDGTFCLQSNRFIRFSYVHELQHALRLVGIEKEVVL